MVERPTRPLPFWERLLRLNLTTVIHRLTCDGMRGDANLCTIWAANGFKYNLRHKSKANPLARARWVVDSIAESDARTDVMEINLVGPTPMHADWRPMSKRTLITMTCTPSEQRLCTQWFLPAFRYKVSPTRRSRLT
jgi:hypothetical protein